MRNYWLKIVLGAAAIFAVGMVGISLVRGTMNRVRTVVESADPIAIPLAFIPFRLNGERLGTLDELVLKRDSPRRVTSVELMVDLSDSTALSRLRGCLLVADFEWEHGPERVNVSAGKFDRGTFHCAAPDSQPIGYEHYGHVSFSPGETTVPLYLPLSMVNDLRKGDFGDTPPDSLAEAARRHADSVSHAAEQMADSMEEAADHIADSIAEHASRLGDSLSAIAEQRADSIRQAVHRRLDSLRRAGKFPP